MKAITLAIFCLALVIPATADDVQPFRGTYPPKFDDAQEHVYKTVGDTELKLWLFRPKTRDLKPRPTIVFFFGGGWRSGSPEQFANQCRALAARGMIAVTADYRVQSRQNATPFECVADAKSAIRWLRQNAPRLGVDPERIVASGGSAGGHIACCTGVIEGLDDPGDDAAISSQPNAMALFNPAVMLANFGEHKLLGEAKAAQMNERLQSRAGEISPIQHLRAGLPPTIIFHGTEDEAVPFETVKLYTELATKLGNRCELKEYPGEPHGFFNPRLRNPERRDAELKNYRSTLAQLDDFLVSLKYLSPPPKEPASEQGSLQPVTPNILRGDPLFRSRQKFLTEQKGHVAFLGGSITEMNGYRPMVMEWLGKEYPETDFRFTNAGIASTCSTTGAFRLQRDILAHGEPDLLLVEFAVNDDQDAAHTYEGAVRGMEGIIRQLRTAHPQCDIIMVCFVNPEMRDQLAAGKTPVSIAAHLDVARHYGVSTIHLAREVTERIAAGTFTWEEYGGTHPAPAGNRIAADMVAQLLIYDRENTSGETARTAPEKPLDPLSYANPELLDLSQGKLPRGWNYSEPDWMSLPGSKRERFLKQSLLWSTTPGSAFQLTFRGETAVAYILAGPDAGQLEVSVDGGPPTTVELYHHFSKGLHYPRSVVLATGLSPGAHDLLITVSAMHHPESAGTAVRVLDLGVNGQPAE